jgi:hypothetical protein
MAVSGFLIGVFWGWGLFLNVLKVAVSRLGIKQ